MKKIITFIVLIFCYYNIASAQFCKIQGLIKDSILNLSIKSATISFCKLNDTSFCYHGISEENGFYKIENIFSGDYQLLISSQGYNPYAQKISIDKVDTILRTNDVYLTPSFVTLENIRVKPAQFYLDNDTLEYNADSYKVRQYATLKELIRKLPGVQINQDGVLKINGIIVQKLLVDNKIFFNDNMLLALNNLPSEIINKIQFYDEADDRTHSLKTGAKKKIKIINIRIKENKKTGLLGDISQAGGADDKYNFGINLNRFNKTSQVSVIGQRGNIGFQSSENVIDNNIHQSGNVNSSAIATDFRKSLGRFISLYGSYSFKSYGNNSLNEIFNENFLGDSSIFTNHAGSNLIESVSHDINFNIEKRGSKSKLVIRPIINITNTQSQSSQQINQFSKTDTLYQSKIKNTLNNNISNYAVLVSYNYKLKKEGQILTFNFEAKKNKDSLNEYNLNFTQRPGNALNAFNQMQLKMRNGYKVLASIVYTTPLRNGSIELGYSYGFDTYTNDSRAYKFNEVDKGYNISDSLMSNIYKIDIKTNKLKVDYNFTGTKLFINLGALVEKELRLNVRSQRNFLLNQNNFNINPSANFSYAINKGSSIQFTYDGSSRLPNFEEIQPYTFTSDSLFIFKGNVNLKSSFSHNFIFNYNKLMPSNSSVFSASATFTLNKNEIQSSTNYFQNGIQEVRFININGNRGVAANINYNFPIKKISSQINFNINVSHNRLPVVINKQLELMKNLYIESTIYLSKQVAEGLDFECQARSTLYGLVNSTKHESSRYFNQYLSGKVNFYYKNGWTYSSIVDFNFSGNLNSSSGSNLPLLSSSVGKAFLKNKACEIKVLVFDWLNRNLNISRISNYNTIQTIRTNSIGRNILVLISYKLREFRK